MSAVCTSEPPAAKAGKLQKQETKLGSDSAMRGRRAGGAAGDGLNGFKILLHGQGCWHPALWGRCCVIAPEIRAVSRPIPGKQAIKPQSSQRGSKALQGQEGASRGVAREKQGFPKWREAVGSNGDPPRQRCWPGKEGASS